MHIYSKSKINKPKLLFKTFKIYRAQLMSLLAMVGVAIAYLWVRIKYLSFASGFNYALAENEYTASLWVRMMTFGKIFWRYLGSVVWPYPVHMETTSEIYTGMNLWFVAMVVVVVMGYWLGWMEKKKLGSVWIWLGWSWFLGMMVPMSGVVPLNDLWYRHWLYLPLAGFAILMYGITNFQIPIIKQYQKLKNKKQNVNQRLISIRSFKLLILSIVVLVYGVLVREQLGHWQDNLSLYEYTLQYRRTVKVLNNLAVEYAYVGRLAEAEKLLKEALGDERFGVQTRLNLAQVYLMQGKEDEAEDEYWKVMEIEDNDYARKQLQMLNKDEQTN